MQWYMGTAYISLHSFFGMFKIYFNTQKWHDPIKFWRAAKPTKKTFLLLNQHIEAEYHSFVIALYHY